MSDHKTTLCKQHVQQSMKEKGNVCLIRHVGGDVTTLIDPSPTTEDNDNDGVDKRSANTKLQDWKKP